MSAPSSPGSAASTSDSNAPGCGSRGNASPTSSAVESLRAIGRTYLATPTSRPSARTLWNPSMFSAAASRARTSASLAVAVGSMGHARVFGPNTHDSYASYDPATSSWKTSQLSLLEEWDGYSETWPRAGTTRNGTAYRLRPLVPLTAATESGLWPTPVAHDDGKTPEAHLAMKARMPGGPRSTITSLAVMVKAVERGMFPTPTTKNNMLSPSMQWWPAHRNLLIPTPTASDGKGGGRIQGPMESRGRTRHSNLRDWVKTPTAAPWSHGGSGGELHKQVAPSGGPLNPQWVAWLMGFPIDWTSLPPSETRSSRRSRNGSAG